MADVVAVDSKYAIDESVEVADGSGKRWPSTGVIWWTVGACSSHSIRVPKRGYQC